MIWFGTLSLDEIGKTGTGNICRRSRNDACLCISAKITLTFTGSGSSADLRKVVGIGLDFIPGVALLAGAKEQNSVLGIILVISMGPYGC